MRQQGQQQHSSRMKIHSSKAPPIPTDRPIIRTSSSLDGSEAASHITHSASVTEKLHFTTIITTATTLPYINP